MKFARSFGAAFALVMLGFVAAQANSSLFWSVQPSSPAVNGPWLGDSLFNISTLYVAHARLAGVGYAPALSVSQTSGQANCTPLPNDGTIEIKTSASTGYACLPSAVGGKMVFIGNSSGQTIDLYSSNSPFVPGTPDTINGTAGSSAYTGFTGKSVHCVAANNGAWYCLSGS